LAVVIRKGVVFVVDQSESRLLDGIATQMGQFGGVSEQSRAAATAVQIGGEVQALHGVRESAVRGALQRIKQNIRGPVGLREYPRAL
jgi:hypothetical protein